MATLEARVTVVEGDVKAHQVMVDGLQDNMVLMREDMNRRFDAVDRRLDLADARASRQFVWLVGVQVMTLAAVVTALAAMLSAIGGR